VEHIGFEKKRAPSLPMRLKQICQLLDYFSVPETPRRRQPSPPGGPGFFPQAMKMSLFPPAHLNFLSYSDPFNQFALDSRRPEK
jgi:hypothetical protein